MFRSEFTTITEFMQRHLLALCRQNRQRTHLLVNNRPIQYNAGVSLYVKISQGKSEGIRN